MKSEESAASTSAGGNVKQTNNKPNLTEFTRTSNIYSSLPSHYGALREERVTDPDLTVEVTKQTEPSTPPGTGTGTGRKKRSSRRNQRKTNNIADGEPTTQQWYGVLQESPSDPEHSFGLSNNLSTESIRNACGYYDDELSDDDLIEVHNTPECFQKLPSDRRAFGANRFGIDSRKKRKNSEENPLCAMPVKTTDDKAYTNGLETSTFFSDAQSDDALTVLNELDAILDVHDTSQLNTSGSTGCEMETKIEDCLLDLDNYLEEMDDCGASNDNNDEDLPDMHGQGPLKKNSPADRRTRTLPSKRKTFPATESVNSIEFLDEAPRSEFERGHGLRKTISCALESKHIDTANETSQIPIDPDAAKIWRRNSMSRTDLLALPDDLNPPVINVDASSSSSPTALSSGNRENENCREQGNNLSVDITNVLESTSHAPIPLTGELSRSISQRDFPMRILCSTSNEMLTQDNIFQNLLVQNGSCTRLEEDRPRQFGRRAEGHPRILSIRSDIAAGNTSCTFGNVNDQRPMSAPATASGGRACESALHEESHSALFIGSESSSVRSSRNPSPVSIISSSDSSSQAPSTTGNIETNLVATETLAPRNSLLDPQSRVQPGFNSEWPHAYGRTLALLCCTLGLFNICRFAVLTAHYGGNFLLQFLLLSIIFGIPMFWLQMCLGAKIKAGPVSMWKISPICRGVGIALVVVQCFIAIYSTVAVAWLFIYLRDSFPSKTPTLYRWQEATYAYRPTSKFSSNLTERVADYFNVAVLQRLQLSRPDVNDVRFRVNDRLAFNLAILWAAVFLILCKGLKSFGKAVFGLTILPLITLVIVTCKIIYVADPFKMQNIFSATDFDDFLINSKTWTAAAQETFLTWGLLGSSVIAITSRIHVSGNTKTTLRRDAILVVLVTFLVLAIAALLGVCCIQILNQHNYIYVPGSFEHPQNYTAVYSVKSPTLNTDLLSYPPKWVPHYSSFIGETYRRPATEAHRESGYQALRFISELFPAVIALSSDSFSWIWSAIAFAMFGALGLAQLCVMWKPISSALGNSTSSVLLSCVTGLLLSIPFATEMGISILHYTDLLLGGSWFIPILWTAQIFGVFLIRGRPYNGDDLVNDLRMSGSMSAFLALSWNVILPTGLIILAIIDYKTSLSNQFYYWRGKSYFSYWARKLGGLTQIGFLLLVPIIAIIQIYRYLANGPPDILDRIQLLYRPSESSSENRRIVGAGRNREDANGRQQSATANANRNVDVQDDAPPKYTPPPSYTTATGARLAKMFRQSIRRSVRRILGEPGRSRPILPIDTEMNQQSLPPDYSTVLTNPSGNTDNTPATSETIEIDQRPSYNPCGQRSLSLGRKFLSHKQEPSTREPASALRTLGRNGNLQRPYTAEDVVITLRSSTRLQQERRASSSRELAIIHPQNDNSFRSIENLILNAEPLGQSPAVGMGDSLNSEAELSNEQNDTSVI